ncbi:DUF1697 domain-containing protein [Saccharicrinis sp. GN24d3]|uniref:DUF1697 domain-containing protein n=1 Tax=Saccharicrinis sp. GN24d3 TaxID=3458416 RepID=UPI0040361BAC
MVAVLRGINVGGKRKILMADLKLLFAGIGFTDVVTYIQSGNVIFNADQPWSNLEIGNKIEQAIADKYGFEVPVIVRSAQELEHIVNNNPFDKGEIGINQLHLTFLKDIPSSDNRLKAESYNFEPDQFVIDKNDVFLCIKGKYHQTKLSNHFFESKFKVPATTRNWKTVLKLLELSR